MLVHTVLIYRILLLLSFMLLLLRQQEEYRHNVDSFAFKKTKCSIRTLKYVHSTCSLYT